MSGKKPQRSPSLLGDRIRQLLGVDQDPDPEDSPPRSRRGLFQSLSSSNLAAPAPPSSSLPPQIPRSFYLGDLDIAARLRGSRSLHNSPAHTCGLGQKYDSSHNHQHHHCQHHRGDSNQRTYSSLSSAGPGDHCATPVTDSELPCGVADALRHLDTHPGPLTSELADTNHSNSARNRNESHLLNYTRYGRIRHTIIAARHLPGCSHYSNVLNYSGPVQLRRHRSSQGLDTCQGGGCRDTCHSMPHVPHPNNRHSVHFDSLSHAAISGLETLDFPPRKKTWPPEGPR